MANAPEFVEHPAYRRNLVATLPYAEVRIQTCQIGIGLCGHEDETLLPRPRVHDEMAADFFDGPLAFCRTPAQGCVVEARNEGGNLFRHGAEPLDEIFMAD